jgi:glucan phosphorylase
MDHLNLLDQYLKEGSNSLLRQWRVVKLKNKENLKAYMIKVRPDCKEFVEELRSDSVLFIAHTKRPSKHKRHILSLAGIVDSFIRNDNRSFTIFAGKASPDC